MIPANSGCLTVAKTEFSSILLVPGNPAPCAAEEEAIGDAAAAVVAVVATILASRV